MLAILETLLLLFFGFVSLLLIGVVLIQKGRGGGLATAFGGGSGTATAFGSKTGDVLTWATSVIFGVFLVLAIVLNLIANFRSPGPAVAVPTEPAPASAPLEGGPLTVPGAVPAEAPTTPPASPGEAPPTAPGDTPPTAPGGAPPSAPGEAPPSAPGEASGGAPAAPATPPSQP
ncbi:MAG: preprotein translocase subunit SecG [Tepidisphaerales bacterium]